MIEGTAIAGEFEQIYASAFFYNDKGVPKWPAQVVNYTNKTQFLFRIEKGVLDINDSGVNDAFAPEDIRVPFRNMIYIGDGLSDVPCMKMMQSYGGASIAVYKEMTQGVKDLLERERVDFIYPADYRAGSALDKTMKNILRRMATADALAEENARQKQMIRRSNEISGQIALMELM